MAYLCVCGHIFVYVYVCTGMCVYVSCCLRHLDHFFFYLVDTWDDQEDNDDAVDQL